MGLLWGGRIKHSSHRQAGFGDGGGVSAAIGMGCTKVPEQS